MFEVVYQGAGPSSGATGHASGSSIRTGQGDAVESTPPVRYSKSCKACRIAKCKCEIEKGRQGCSRCRSAAIPCVFTPSRRGRVKGSKNRKSIAQINSSVSEEPKPDLRSITTLSGQDDDLDPDQAGSITPLDPFPSYTDNPSPEGQGARAHGRSSLAPHQLTRGLLNIVEKTFPVEVEEDESGSMHIDASASESNNPGQATSPEVVRDGEAAQGFGHPLLFLAEQARHHWADPKKSNQSPASIARSITTDLAGDQTGPSPLGSMQINGDELAPSHRLPRPVTMLPAEDRSLYDRWAASTVELQHVLEDTHRFYEHGLHGVKRDVGHGLDAVQRGLVKEDTVSRLFQAFFTYVNPQWALLDISLHTPHFVRNRSALLFTVILSVGATAIATLPGSDTNSSTLATKLDAHAEKLHLAVSATAAKSTEIIQAILISTFWSYSKSRRIDDARWIRLGAATRMAVDIGLHRSKYHHDTLRDPVSPRKNQLMTRLALILVEDRWWESMVNPKNASSSELFHPSAGEWTILKSIPAEDPRAILVARYEMLMFDLGSATRLAPAPTSHIPSSHLSSDSERILLREFVNRWLRRWYAPTRDPLHEWFFRYLAMSFRFSRLLRVVRFEFGDDDQYWGVSARQEILSEALEMLENSLLHPLALHMLQGTATLVVCCAMVTRMTPQDAPSRDLLLRLALRLAGDPHKRATRTYFQHNGYQILNMICLSRNEPTIAGDLSDKPLETDAGPVNVDWNSIFSSGDHQPAPQVVSPFHQTSSVPPDRADMVIDQDLERFFAFNENTLPFPSFTDEVAFGTDWPNVMGNGQNVPVQAGQQNQFVPQQSFPALETLLMPDPLLFSTWSLP